MTLREVEQTLRSGDGLIRPIIDWLHDEDPAVIIPSLQDPDTCASVLYILKELPARRISAPMQSAMRALLPSLPIGGQERVWAEEVLREVDD